MALIHEASPGVLADIITNENEGGEVATTKFAEGPTNLSPGPERDHSTPTRSVVDKGLPVSVLVVARLECVCKDDFADGRPVKMVDLVLIHPWSLTLAELPLRERVNGNAASGGKQTTIEFDRPT